jgi:hypothetical protein
MTLADLHRPGSRPQAIAEFVEPGREVFLDQYGFRK